MAMRSRSASLSDRWREEAAFHDQMSVRDTRWTSFRAYGLSSASIRYAQSLLGDIRGKTVVDCGCGDGTYTVELLQPGAAVVGFDISHSMSRVTLDRLTRAAHGTGCLVACQRMAAEQMAYASSSIDAVFGISVLHHLALTPAAVELARVLKPGGRAVFVEPLNRNPVPALYRSFTSERHTETERPLDYQDIGLFRSHFSQVRHKEFYLLSVFAAGFAVLRSRCLFEHSLAILMRIDEWLFRRLPWLRRYAWITIIELRR